MRVLNESIVRRVNRENHCTGRFRKGRLKSRVLLNDAVILACITYMDPTPIRAGLAETPEDSDLTSIQARLRQLTVSHQVDAEASNYPGICLMDRTTSCPGSSAKLSFS
jgi:hypothetical protein